MALTPAGDAEDFLITCANLAVYDVAISERPEAALSPTSYLDTDIARCNTYNYYFNTRLLLIVNASSWVALRLQLMRETPEE
jgi:hypothetical protein